MDFYLQLERKPAIARAKGNDCVLLQFNFLDSDQTFSKNCGGFFLGGGYSKSF